MTFQNCGDEYSSLLSDTWFEGVGLDGLDLSKSSSQPKSKENKYKSWIFQYRLQTYILGVHCVSTDEKKSLLVEDLQTLLRPQAVGLLSFQLLSSAISKRYSSSARWKQFDFDSYRQIRPIREQDSTHYDPIVP